MPEAGGEDGDGAVVVNKGLVVEGEDMLSERETIMLSLQFCLLWFVVCVPPFLCLSYIRHYSANEWGKGKLLPILLPKMDFCRQRHDPLLNQ